VPVRPSAAAVGSELVGLLPVDDPRLGIRQQELARDAHGGALVADVVEVGELVEDQHVRDPVVPGESPVRVHPPQQRRVGHEPPGFVVDHPPLPAVRVQQRGLHPRRRARHQHRDQRRVLRDPGQVEGDHRQRRIEPTVDGPSNSPARSPATRRRSAWPTSRPSSASRPCRRHPRSGRGCGRRPSAGSARRSPAPSGSGRGRSRCAPAATSPARARSRRARRSGHDAGPRP
jgi:hypothetical protein